MSNVRSAFFPACLQTSTWFWILPPFQPGISVWSITCSMRPRKLVNVSAIVMHFSAVIESSGKFESKYCGELITHDGRRQMLEIPSTYFIFSIEKIIYTFQDWPTNRRYDVDHYKDVKKTKENFHITARSTKYISENLVHSIRWLKSLSVSTAGQRSTGPDIILSLRRCVHLPSFFL